MIVEHRASLILFNVLSELKNKKQIFLLPANTCPIVVITYIKSGVSYELIDIDPNTLCLDEDLVLEKLNRNPRMYGGVHYIHTYGVENNPHPFFEKVKLIDSNIFIIDDKCLNVPKFQKNNIFNDVDLEFYSTGYSKYIDIGWGGFGYLKSNIEYRRKILPYEPNDLHKLTRDLKNSFDKNSSFLYRESDWLGDSSFAVNQDEYQKQIIERIGLVKQHKYDLNAIYARELPIEIQLQSIYQNWRFNIFVPNRNELLNKIFDAGLFASAHYASVAYMFGQSAAFHAERIDANILNLFNDLRFDVNSAEKVVSIIKKHLNERGCSAHYQNQGAEISR